MQPEHPDIVPIVGVDGDGQYSFVMKYVESETLEAVIAKLRDGDAATCAPHTGVSFANLLQRDRPRRRVRARLGILSAGVAALLLGTLAELGRREWFGCPAPLAGAQRRADWRWRGRVYLSIERKGRCA